MRVRTPIEPPQSGGYQQGPGGPPGPPKRGGGSLGPLLLISVGLVIAVVLVGVAIVFTRGDSAEDTPLGGPQGTTQVATAAAPTTVDPQAATKAQVIASYRAAFDDQLAVGRDPKATAGDDRLRAHHTGDALGTIQISMVKFKSAGKVYVGEVKLNPKVVELTGDTATVQDCLDDATGATDARTGEIVEPATRIVTTVTAKMKWVDGVWKMANYRDEKRPCVPDAS